MSLCFYSARYGIEFFNVCFCGFVSSKVSERENKTLSGDCNAAAGFQTSDCVCWCWGGESGGRPAYWPIRSQDCVHQPMRGETALLPLAHPSHNREREGTDTSHSQSCPKLISFISASMWLPSQHFNSFINNRNDLLKFKDTIENADSSSKWNIPGLWKTG